MAPLATAFMSAFGGGGAAATAAGTAGTVAAGTAGTVAGGAAGAAGAGLFGSGSLLAGILQGTATLMGVMASREADETQARSLELAAQDAERQKSLEVLQGIDRRTSIKRALMDQVGEQSNAYAASGVDLSFGSPTQARQDAFREADLGLETATGSEQTQVARLGERAGNYRAQASSVRRGSKIRTASEILGAGASFLRRG